MTQTSIILGHLYDYGSITSLEAINLYGITRLSDTIFKLRQRGYYIKSTTESSTNRYGSKVTYARYTLGGAE